MKNKGIEIFGDTVYNYDECANWDTECPRDCDGYGCMMFRPVTYKRS